MEPEKSGNSENTHTHTFNIARFISSQIYLCAVLVMYYSNKVPTFYWAPLLVLYISCCINYIHHKKSCKAWKVYPYNRLNPFNEYDEGCFFFKIDTMCAHFIPFFFIVYTLLYNPYFTMKCIAIFASIYAPVLYYSRINEEHLFYHSSMHVTSALSIAMSGLTAF